MVMPIIPRGPIDDVDRFMAFSAAVPAASPPTPDRVTPDVFVRRIFYGNLPIQMPDGVVVPFWGFFDPASGIERFPSETIRVTEGQIVHVQLNPSRNTHTVHHHGIEPTPMNDGVGHHSFEVDLQYTYQWLAAQSGTYFYHCHKNTPLHFELGMYGGLIIDPPSGRGFIQRANEEVRYDVEAVWVADDVDPHWHHMGHSAGIGFPFGTDEGLNNFHPMYHMISGVPSPDTITDPRVAVNCTVGQTVLLRIVNAAYALLNVTIEGLDGEVVEADGRPLGQLPHGKYSQPYTWASNTPMELSTAQRRSVLVTPTKAGTYKVKFEFINAWAMRGMVTTVETLINVTGANRVRYIPIEGRDRFATNARISLNAFPETAPTAVIASGVNWPDALAGSALAGALGGPLLLVQPNAVPSSVENELRRLGVNDAIIVGGPASVSGNVRTRLQAIVRSGTVARLSGTDRFATAAAVAARVKNAVTAAGGTFENTAFIVSGTGFADALSASALAAKRAWPILLATRDTLPRATERALTSLGITKVVIVGGPRSVGSAVESRLVSLLGALNVERVDGLTRYETAAAMADFGVANGLDWKNPAIATGQTFPDALAGGVLQGKKNSVLLLTPSTSLDPVVNTALLNHRADIASLTYLGGRGSLSTGVRNAAEAILG